MKNNKSKKDKIRQGNQRDFGLLYDTLLSGGTYSDYRSELQDRSMPQEVPQEITEDDILAAWILGKDEESEQYARGGHIHQDQPWMLNSKYLKLNPDNKGIGQLQKDLNQNSFTSGSTGSSDSGHNYTAGIPYVQQFDSLGGLGFNVAANANGADNDPYAKFIMGDTSGGFLQQMMSQKSSLKEGANYIRGLEQNFGVGDNAYLAQQYNQMQPIARSTMDADSVDTWKWIFDPSGIMHSWGIIDYDASEGQNYLNNIAEQVENRNKQNFNTAVTNSNKLNLWNQLSQPYMAACGGKMKNRLASGGYLNSHYDYITDPLVKVDAGGTHQENPNEGVQTSIAPDGQPNLVEEGETIINNQDDAYVFSDRIVADEEILKSHLLNTKFAGKTYADISKELDKIIEEHKNDEISKRTFDEMISRLQQAQEDQKFQEKQEEIEKFLDTLSDEQKEQLAETMVEEAEAEQQAAEEQAIAEQQAQEQAAQEQQMQPEQAPGQAVMEQPEEQIVPSRYDQMMSRAQFADAANQGMFGLGGTLQIGGYAVKGSIPQRRYTRLGQILNSMNPYTAPMNAAETVEDYQKSLDAAKNIGHVAQLATAIPIVGLGAVSGPVLTTAGEALLDANIAAANSAYLMPTTPSLIGEAVKKRKSENSKDNTDVVDIRYKEGNEYSKGGHLHQETGHLITATKPVYDNEGRWIGYETPQPTQWISENEPAQLNADNRGWYDRTYDKADTWLKNHVALYGDTNINPFLFMPYVGNVVGTLEGIRNNNSLEVLLSAGFGPFGKIGKARKIARAAEKAEVAKKTVKMTPKVKTAEKATNVVDMNGSKVTSKATKSPKSKARKIGTGVSVGLGAIGTGIGIYEGVKGHEMRRLEREYEKQIANDSILRYLEGYSKDDSLGFEQYMYDRMREQDGLTRFVDSIRNANTHATGGHLHQDIDSRITTEDQATSIDDGVFHVAPGYFNRWPYNQDFSYTFQLDENGFNEYLRNNLPDYSYGAPGEGEALIGRYPAHLFAIAGEGSSSRGPSSTQHTGLRFSYSPETGRWYPVSANYSNQNSPSSTSTSIGENGRINGYVDTTPPAQNTTGGLGIDFGRLSGVFDNNGNLIDYRRSEGVSNPTSQLGANSSGSGKKQKKKQDTSTKPGETNVSQPITPIVEPQTIEPYSNPHMPDYSIFGQYIPAGLTPYEVNGNLLGYTDPFGKFVPIGGYSEYGDTVNSVADQINSSNTSSASTNTGKDSDKDKDQNNSTTDWSTYLRFAPAVGSGIQYLSDLFGITNRNNYTNPNLFQRSINAIPNAGFTPLGGYRTFNPFDETYQQNALRSMNEAARRAVINNSNGNYGAALAALDALNYNTGNQFGDLALKAREYNDKERQAIDEYNLKINQINASLSMNAQEKNQAIAAQKARLTAALAEMRQKIEDTNDAAKSANMTNFYQNVGNVGKEYFNMNMVRYNPAFYYTITDDGRILYKNGFDGLSESDQAFVRSVAEPQAAEQRKKHLEETNKKADETTDSNGTSWSPMMFSYFVRPGLFGYGFGTPGLFGYSGLTNNEGK